MHPEKEAVVSGDLRLNYSELNRRVNKFARALLNLGLKKGDRLAIYSLNSNQYCETVFACAKIGAIVVPINFRLTQPEIQYILEDSGATSIVAGHDLFPMIESVAGLVGIKNLIIVGEYQGDKICSYETLIGKESADELTPPEQAAGDDAIIIMYTSGTTGRPKGTILTHNNLFWNSLNCMHGFYMHSKTISLISVPLFHAGGLNGVMVPTIYAGGTIILQPIFDPQNTLELVQKERVTFLGGVPVMLQMLLDVPDFDSYDLSSIETIMTGAMPVPISLIEAYKQKDITFQQAYGLTEATSSVLYLRHEDALRKAGSAGKPFLHVDVKIVDDQGNQIKPGEIGEICVRGGNVMKGYWKMPKETAATIKDGWLHTGDMATIDEEGYVYIKDRKRDLIISGGENIYPAEVEEVLNQHPMIHEAGVIGVKDPKWGESVRAVIVPKSGMKPTLEDIVTFCEGRLARYKHPKSIVFVDELPKNVLGKILHKELRERYGN